ncbi:MAG: cytochrome c biogenesis CcdA family protein [Vulcanimicrobiaceae bacterium]
MTGSSVEELRDGTHELHRLKIFLHAVAFTLGFSFIFVTIFGLGSAALGATFANNKDLIAKIGGVVIIVLGLNMMGVFRIPFLAMTKRVEVRSPNRSLVASFLVGVGFAAGWSPCVGPFLASVIVLASQQSDVNNAVLLLAVYSIGLAIPFLIAAAAISFSLGLMNRIKRFLMPIEFAAGALLVATGFVAFFGLFSRVASFFSQYIPTPSL